MTPYSKLLNHSHQRRAYMQIDVEVSEELYADLETVAQEQGATVEELAATILKGLLF